MTIIDYERSYAKAYVLVLAIIMVCPLAWAHKDKEGTVKVTVFGAAGDGPSVAAVVPNAVVIFHWNYTGEPMCWNDGHCKKTKKPHKKVLQIRAVEGSFSVALSPGVWDVFAYRDLFVPTCTQVFVEAGKTTTVELRFPGLAPHSQE